MFIRAIFSGSVPAQAIRLLLLTLIPAQATALDAQLPRPLNDADFISFDARQAELGQLLFYDKILSGNRNISCGTCHHHELHGTDGVSLGLGEGANGLGTNRQNGTEGAEVHARVPRNAPALWNLAHRDVTAVFHDGRLAISDDHASGFDGPAKDRMPHGLQSLLAAQALFPPTSDTEMAGQPGENEVADATAKGMDLVWPILAARVADIPEYQILFQQAFDHVDGPADITIVEVANAIAAFIGTEWRNHDSPFDRYLAGDETALSDEQMRGMNLFFADGGCADCHSGPLFSDQEFYALGLPQFGPGKTLGFDPVPRDIGRLGKSLDLADAYRFKTPFLRNVALSGPYGHNGAMPSLDAIVRHHFDPQASRAEWMTQMAGLPEAGSAGSKDFEVLRDAQEMERQAKTLDIKLSPASDADISDIVAFLHGLTGETAKTRPMGRPDKVPSGLPVD